MVCYLPTRKCRYLPMKIISCELSVRGHHLSAIIFVTTTPVRGHHPDITLGPHGAKIGLRQGCSLFRVNHSSASRNLGHRFIEQWNTGEADGESALQPSSLFCHTHTAYAAVARDTTAATAGAVDGIVDPASSTSASTVSRARRLPSRRGRAVPVGCARVQAAWVSWVCAGLRC